MPPRLTADDLDLYIGRVYGRLTVLSVSREFLWSTDRWVLLCRCVCGNERKIVKASVDSGATQSCGCLMQEAHAKAGKFSRTHGESRITGNTPEYNAWRSMLKRCYLQTHASYKFHGGRGIAVCDQWRTSFETFLADVGRRPSKRHSLDRFPNNDGNYEPGNVRWATPKQQQRNMRSNKLITFKGETMCATAWAERLGATDPHLISRRLRTMSVERALTLPVRRYD